MALAMGGTARRLVWAMPGNRSICEDTYRSCKSELAVTWSGWSSCVILGCFWAGERVLAALYPPTMLTALRRRLGSLQDLKEQQVEAQPETVTFELHGRVQAPQAQKGQQVEAEVETLRLNEEAQCQLQMLKDLGTNGKVQAARIMISLKLKKDTIANHSRYVMKACKNFLDDLALLTHSHGRRPFCMAEPKRPCFAKPQSQLRGQNTHQTSNLRA